MKVAFEVRSLQNDQVAVTEKVAALSKAITDMGFEIEHIEIAGQDRLADFELQRLMSAFLAAERVSSNVQKKIDDTIAGIINNIK
jgi:hypothetical protein